MRPIFLSLLLSVAATSLMACSVNEPSDKGMAPMNVSIQQTDNSYDPSANKIEEYMTFLASDDLKGRETGTPGYNEAADYVAKQFKTLGLTPAGEDGTYFQTVTLKRAYRIAESDIVNAETDAGESIPMIPGVDYAVRPSIAFEESSVTAPVVFAGYGLVAPKEGRDDYKGLDVEGKIVAIFPNTPSGIQTEERAFYGSQKGKIASQHGALGLLYIPTPTSEKILSFDRIIKEGRLDSAAMSWLAPDGSTFTRAPGIQASAGLSMQGAEKLFDHAPTGLEDILNAAESEGGITPTFDLPLTVTISQKSKIDEVKSANVVGLIEGTDPDLKNEVLILSAHLDHIGISKIDAEDVINNGALDNAAGIATLLEAARMMKANTPPRRSVMFLAVTGEEKGLLGSQYFAKNPTVPKEDIVGDINLDMPILTYDFTDVVVFGGTRSTFNDAIIKAAGEMGIVVSPDPMPDQGIFTRSDHFRFVEEGIPSVMLATGYASGGKEAWSSFFAEHYHQPSDEMSNNLNFDAAAKFAELNTRIAFTLANADERPLWNKNDFFAEQFGGPMIK